MTCLEADNVSYRVGAKEILHGVSLAVARGEYVALLGPNGAGKTTLIRCLARIARPTGGEIRLAGRPLNDLARRDLARRLAYVPQGDRSDPPFTVEQFVAMGRYPHASPFTSVTSDDRSAVADALARTGLAPLAGRMLHSLSGGERQKVHIAAALAQSAEILLLDEPTTFLDCRSQAEISRLLAEVHCSGVTIVCVTHDLNRAVDDAQRIVALREGHLVHDGPPESFADARTLERIYDIPFELISRDGAPPWIAPPRLDGPERFEGGAP